MVGMRAEASFLRFNAERFQGVEMKTYEYGRIARLAEALEKAKIQPEIITQILEGGQSIRSGDSGEVKADWMREAMRKMDQQLDKDTRHAVREACACCLGGKRQQLVKEIAKKYKNSTLEERVKAANETKMVFGHSVTLQEDNTVVVSFAPEGQAEYRCVCLPKATEPLPITYCYCCGGHVKHHLQTALGRPLELRVRSSALSSGGKRPCMFVFSLKEHEN
jgi:hypothetical protein